MGARTPAPVAQFASCHFLCRPRAVSSARSFPLLSLLSELHEEPERGEELLRQSPRMGPGALSPAPCHQDKDTGFCESTRRSLQSRQSAQSSAPRAAVRSVLSRERSQSSPCGCRVHGTCFPSFYFQPVCVFESECVSCSQHRQIWFSLLFCFLFFCLNPV